MIQRPNCHVKKIKESEMLGYERFFSCTQNEHKLENTNQYMMCHNIIIFSLVWCHNISALSLVL